jgi:ribosome-associated protein
VVGAGFFGYVAFMPGPDPRQFAIEIARIVHDNKSEDVVALDLRGVSPVTDFTVICTGTSDRQMRAVADMIIEYGKKVGEKPYGFCGHETAAWIVIDYIDVVVHIFDKPYRDYYDLELLWGDTPRIEWARSESA